MIAQDTVLVQLIRLIDRIPTPPPPTRRPPGRPIVYSDRLFLKALLLEAAPRHHRGRLMNNRSPPGSLPRTSPTTGSLRS